MFPFLLRYVLRYIVSSIFQEEGNILFAVIFRFFEWEAVLVFKRL